MKRGLSASYRYPEEYNMSKTAKLTNSMNSTYLRSFNQWGGVSYADILSNYPEDMINACWNNLSRFILENYQAGKGTMIKGFGTFTFTNVEYSLEGTTNQYNRDIKRRKPVFIVSTEFVEYLKPGMYTKKGGLLYYTQKINNSVSIVKVNYAKISYGTNISKEECYTIISTTFKLMGDQIRRGEYIPKYMEDLGLLLLRGHIFGMKFEDNLFDILSQKTQKLIHTKKNMRLYMETKDSEGIPHWNLEDIDKAERDIRPKKAVVTRITKSGDNWLRKNMGINVKKDIKDEPRDDLYLNKANNKKEFYVDQRDYRHYPLQNLLGLNIPQNILEGIYNNKYLLLRNMKSIDRHGDGLIPKYDFINCFRDTNCHHLLRIELIEKITDAYINNNPEVIMIHYNNLINALCDDIKYIARKEYNNFPIEKYKYTIPENNKRAQSAYAYNKESGNLQRGAISEINTYNNLEKVDESEIYDDLNKIDGLSEFIRKDNKINKMISFLGLISILRKHKLIIDKVQMIKILKFFNISNPNAFYLNEILRKINQYFNQIRRENKNRERENNFNSQYSKSLNEPSKIETTHPDISQKYFTSNQSPFPTEKNKLLNTPFDLDPLEKIKRIIISSRIDFKKECEKFISCIKGKNGVINQYQFRNFIKKLNLGLSNIEIEDIINKSGKTYDGYINLEEFYKYITNKEINLEITERHIIEILKQIKQYLYKYYNNPRLAFDINDQMKRGYIDFEIFKKLIYELYFKERQKEPNYPLMKAIYDFIDVRKDGVIDSNEWNKVFSITESNLDVIKGPGSQPVRDWEGSEELADIYKLISKNKKIIEKKAKLYNMKTTSNMLIQENNLIDILIHVLGSIRLSYPQWKMIVSLGDTERRGIIDFNAFITAIDSYANMWQSHPRYLINK